MAIEGEDLVESDAVAPLRRIGVRELKERTSAVVRQVEQDGEAIDITRRGEVVARIVPIQRRDFDPGAIERWWSEHRALGRRISDGWPEGVTAVEAIRDVRDDGW